MSLLTQALTLGLAVASISIFGRRNRMVIVFDATQSLYHSPTERASAQKDFCPQGMGIVGGVRWWSRRMSTGRFLKYWMKRKSCLTASS
jgi:hypothetical protein